MRWRATSKFLQNLQRRNGLREGRLLQMRNIVAVCMSTGRARVRAAQVLDKYLWRIGDATWRGRASQACLARISKDLRWKASRSTAVAVHEVKNGSLYKEPLFVVGSRTVFGPRGVVAVSTAVRAPKIEEHEGFERARAVLEVAAFFHDMGKAGVIFQDKIRASKKEPGARLADKVRHEYISFALWDILTNGVSDAELSGHLKGLTAIAIDDAWKALRAERKTYFEMDKDVEVGCLRHPGLVRSIALLILTHHRLPQSSAGSGGIWANAHVREAPTSKELYVFQQGGFWHDPALLNRLHDAASHLSAGPFGMADVVLRTCLQLGDHLGSKNSDPSASGEGVHIANLYRTPKDTRKLEWGDTLSTHTEKVMRAARDAFDMLCVHSNSLPSVHPSDIPSALLRPPSAGSYGWQGRAAQAAASVACDGGGFFGCIIAGTGSGKTFGLPSVLVAATLADPVLSRRKVRFTLGLGLRTLASQSARAYTDDIGFRSSHVRVMVGSPPIEFHDVRPASGGQSLEDGESVGMENLEVFGNVDAESSEFSTVEDLSWSPDDELPELVQRLFGQEPGALRLIQTPVLCATVDQVMASVRPLRSRHLAASLRVLTSDLVLDELDQLSAEDITCVCALVRQAGAAGRRVVVASATLPLDIARAAFLSYKAGWHDYAAFVGASPDVGVVVAGDAEGALSCMSNCSDIIPLFEQAAAAQAVPAQVRRILPQVLPYEKDWDAVVNRVSSVCDDAHTHHALEGVSVGLVRVARISCATALAERLACMSRPVGVRRSVILLHARMTRAARSFIENELRMALNRKNHPLGNVRALLDNSGLSGDVQLVVVSSPVVETGNDLDFDYCITDPTDARSVVQVAGRVLRHRRAIEPCHHNLFLLNPPLQIAAGEQTLARPGPETKPAAETCVATREVWNAHPTTPDFLGMLANDADAGHLLVHEPGACPALDAEVSLRTDMIQGQSFLTPWLTSDMDRVGKGRLDMRRFRRRSHAEHEISRAEDRWKVYDGVKEQRFGVSVCRNSVPRSVLLSNPESAAVAWWNQRDLPVPPNAHSVSVPIDLDKLLGGKIRLSEDPFWGIVLENQNPLNPFGKV